MNMPLYNSIEDARKGEVSEDEHAKVELKPFSSRKPLPLSTPKNDRDGNDEGAKAKKVRAPTDEEREEAKAKMSGLVDMLDLDF